MQDVVGIPHTVLRWEKKMDVNFLTFSPAKNRKGAAAFRKLRSMGKKTTQQAAGGSKVKGGPT